MPIDQDFPKNHEVIGKQTKLALTHERLFYF
jgi:hypothetical protein